MKLYQYHNGNAVVNLSEDGTRVIEYEGELKLEYPLNIDIRVSTACSLGKNPYTGKAVCEFCHESAMTNGSECDYNSLKEKLFGLPKGIELAIGGNKVTPGLIDFLEWSKEQGYICNLTVNYLHIGRDARVLKILLKDDLIKGLGISYRKGFAYKQIDSFFINHPNVVLHVIAGIDEVDEILKTPFKKVLVLGYKTFGFGVDYFSPDVEKNIKTWYWWVSKLFDKDVCSFDNLALEQLNIKRFFSDDKWSVFNQGEHSFYIDAVNKIFAPSSRSANKENWNLSIKEYFKKLEK